MADRRLVLVGCHQSMPAMVALWKRGQGILATKAEQKA
jgi:hypothetical protein